MRSLKNTAPVPQFWMIALVIFLQAVWNPVVLTVSNLQFYSATMLLLIFFVPSLILRAKLDFSVRTSDSFPLWAYLGYGLVFILSVLIYGLNQFAIGNFARLGSLLLMVMFIQQYEPRLENIVSFYFLLSCCLSLILLVKLISSGISISNRISPVGQGSANAFGATLAVLLLLRLSLDDSYSRSKNIQVYLLGFPIAFLTILGTYSRGATLGLVLGLLVLAMQKIRLAHIPRILGMACLLLILVELSGVYQYSFLARYSTTSFQDSSGRTIIFQNALDAFAQNPLVGSGVGSKLNPFISGESSVHNVFLQVVGETGLLGLSLLLLILATVVTRYLPKLSVPALACLFMVSITDNHFLAVQFHLTVGLIYLCLLRDRRNRNLDVPN